jgi:hypothetical protein
VDEQLSRRQILQKGLGIAILPGILPASDPNISSEIQNSFLWGLAHEKSREGYKGFTERLKEGGFVSGEIGYKTNLEEGEWDLVLLGSPPIGSEKEEESLVTIVDFLIKEHGFDSIGLPLVYGPPRKNMELELRKDYYDFTFGLNWFGSHTSEGPSLETQEDFLVKLALPGSLRKYAKQNSKPAYGIEDKMLAFEAFSINGTIMCINSLLKVIKDNRERDVPYDELPEIEKKQRFVEFVMGKYPELKYPGNNLKEVLDNLAHGRGSLRKVYERFFIVSFIEGTAAAAKNIEKNAKELKSKKSIVLTDFYRLLDKGLIRQVADNMVGRDYEIPNTFAPMQNRLAQTFCYLMYIDFGKPPKG